MSTSRIKARFSLIPKQKPRWPDPEPSIGIFRGVKKGNYSCWEAVGPAKEAFEEVQPQITRLLEDLCGPVPSSSFVLFDIFMIGETKSTAIPHIMFSCKHHKSRKAAVNVVEKSDVLQQCPPGIHLGDWDYPPDLKNLRFLSSSLSYSSLARLTDASRHDYELVPIFDPYKPQTVRAMQLRVKETCGASETYRTATIGSIVEISGKRSYIAPAHVFSSLAQDMPSDGLPWDDSDCEFGGFDTPDDHEAEFMSQYSVTPESSDAEDEWEFDVEHLSDVDSDGSSPGKDEIQHSIVSDVEEAGCLLSQVESVTPSSSGSVPDNLNLNALDYYLLEIADDDKFSLDLPILSERSVGHPGPGAINVTAFTGSGKLLAGVLSDRRTCVRLPHTTSYIEVLSVKFQHSLHPGDSGTVVRDASTGVIYGHVIAGDTESQMAFIVPAEDMLDDLMANTGDNRTLTVDYNMIPQLSQDLMTPDEQTGQSPYLEQAQQPTSDIVFLGSSPTAVRPSSQYHSMTTAGSPLDAETWKDETSDFVTQDAPPWLLSHTQETFPPFPDFSLALPMYASMTLVPAWTPRTFDPDIRRGDPKRSVLPNRPHSKAVAIKRIPRFQRQFELEEQIRRRDCGLCIDSGGPMSDFPKTGPEWVRRMRVIPPRHTDLPLLDSPWTAAVSRHVTDIIPSLGGRGSDMSDWAFELSFTSVTHPLLENHDILDTGALYFPHGFSVVTLGTPADYICLMSSGFQLWKLGSLHSQELVFVIKELPECNGILRRALCVFHCLGGYGRPKRYCLKVIVKKPTDGSRQSAGRFDFLPPEPEPGSEDRS